MSMTSMQVERLRETATRVEIFLNGCTDAIPMNTHEQLRSAANTIWELRNKLAGVVDQREKIELLKDENAKLREQVVQLQADWESERGYANQMEAKEKRAVSENAKLRELCKDIWNDACHFDEFWDYVYDDGTIYREDELPHYQERMNELGIEAG